MTYQFLLDINPSKEDWEVKVRITRIWDAININNNSLISLDMLLLDEQGTIIHAKIEKNFAQKFRHLAKEGLIYKIRNFKVLKEISNYRPVSNEQKIAFVFNTNITLEEETSSIAKDKFSFADYQTIISRCNIHTFLTDIIGKLEGIGSIQTFSKGGLSSIKRDLQLKLICGSMISITLWGEIAREISEDLRGIDDTQIVVCTSTQVKTYGGKINLSSTSATKIRLNFDIPERTSLLQRYSKESTLVKELQPLYPHIQVEDMMLKNRKHIADIINMTNENNDQENIYTVMATIIEINHKYGWCYLACDQNCTKKVTQRDAYYWCEKCEKIVQFPVYRFKVNTVVEDDTSITTFVIFDGEVEKLLNVSANELMKKSDADLHQLPTILNTLKNKKFVFQIRLSNYNLINGKQDYTVRKIFLPNQKLEATFEGKDYRHIPLKVKEEQQSLPEEIVKVKEEPRNSLEEIVKVKEEAKNVDGENFSKRRKI